MGTTNNGKKYELVREDKIEHKGRVLYRIRALFDFSDVKAGDLGGYIEHECNLSQKGDCWVYDKAKVYRDGLVQQDAQVRDDAEVYDNAKIYGFAEVYDLAEVYGFAKVYDNAKVYGFAEVYALQRSMTVQ